MGFNLIIEVLQISMLNMFKHSQLILSHRYMEKSYFSGEAEETKQLSYAYMYVGKNSSLKQN